MAAKRVTPIEQFIQDGELLGPKQRYEKKRKQEGFVRRAYWVHREDQDAVAEFVRDLERKRTWTTVMGGEAVGDD